MDELMRKYSITLRVHNSKQEYRLTAEVKAGTDIEEIKAMLKNRFEVLIHEVFK